ncbi:MAG: PASTA domain-containing protein [Prevotellaceae bacterium]|jgi:beta-lactam-binding protein with PASTA domain|nr:PASTA domain-containing protein [Prevotellaceae bacterium]
MTKKKSSDLLAFILSKYFLINLAIAVVVVILLVAIVLGSLRSYTNHGEFVEVPNLKDKPLTEAIALLEEQHLAYEVVDSAFLPDRKPGIVIEQTPVANEKIKRYRQIYLVINSLTKPMITLPDVRDLSSRHAVATLEVLGLKVSKIEYVPSEYRDLVKDMKSGGRVLAPGSKLPHGSGVTLVVGEGLSEDVEITMPSFRKLSYTAAAERIDANRLNLRLAQFDETPRSQADSAAFFVYRQQPLKGAPVPMGSSVTLWLTKNKKLLEYAEEEYMQMDSLRINRNASPDIEEFF